MDDIMNLFITLVNRFDEYNDKVTNTQYEDQKLIMNVY